MVHSWLKYPPEIKPTPGLSSSSNATKICINQTYRYSYLPSHEMVSVHFNNFYCTEICDNLRKDLVMFTYIYLNVDECWLKFSMPQQMINLQLLFSYAVIPENVVSEDEL